MPFDSRRPQREFVAQVADRRHSRPGRRAVPLEPEQLGKVHLRRNGAPDIVEIAIARAADLRRFGLRAVIHPAKHIGGAVQGASPSACRTRDEVASKAIPRRLPAARGARATVARAASPTAFQMSSIR